MTYKIGFHTGPGGNPTGIGEYFKQLDAAGIPAHLKSADHYGPCFELTELAKKSGVPHKIVFRLSTRGQNDGFDYDVPRYATTPKNAAHIHWQATLAKMPPEHDKKFVWIEPINEIDKNRADWLGEFAYELSILAMADGYKTAHFGWSGGEPEYDHWKTPGMRKFLAHASAHPDQVAVSLHEYSFVVSELVDETPYYLVGRFQQLFDACADMGIGRPKVFVTEFGWEYRNVPAPSAALPMLKEAADLYARFDDVESVAIWYLGQNFGDIHNQTQKLIAPVTRQALDYKAPGGIEPDPNPDPTPPGTNETDEQRWWRLTIDEQKSHGLQLAETAIQNAIRKDEMHPVTKEMYSPSDPPMMAAEDWKYRRRARRVYIWKDGVVRRFLAPSSGPQPDPEPEPPPAPPPPSGNKMDLLPYFVPTSGYYGPLYELKDPDGAQRRVQTLVDHATKSFWIAKGNAGRDGKSEFEQLRWDGNYIHRGLDTSPGAGRFYVQYETGQTDARWCPRFMSVGQEWWGPGHHVQFFLKSDCGRSSMNSGPATNHITLYRLWSSVTFNGITVKDVIEIGRPGGERFWFARDFGMIGWKSEWNSSFISEIHKPGARPNNELERVCIYTLP